MPNPDLTGLKEAAERLQECVEDAEAFKAERVAVRAADVKLVLVAAEQLAEAREALGKQAEGWGNALELNLLPPQHRAAATILRDEAASLGKGDGHG